MTSPPPFRERMAELAAVIAADTSTDDPPPSHATPDNLPRALAERIARIGAQIAANQLTPAARRTA